VALQTLALCFDAPMQSWGIRSRSNIRDTQREPTKSGVIGLIGAALGMHRHDDQRLARLARLKMGVRVDREGVLERDYHTVQDVPTTDGTKHRTTVSQRYYLADAVFLVVLEDHEGDLLNDVHDAVTHPQWPLFFGRRAFVPARALITNGRPGTSLSGLGLSDMSIDALLTQHPWLENRHDVRRVQDKRRDRVALRAVVDCDPSDPDAEMRYDVPLSFDPANRRFAARTVVTTHVLLTDDLIATEETSCISAN
jgi:CRISPR system Cascade subunit CasD